MNKLPNHTALKEWSTVVEALGRGEQILLLRKGGIADATFGIEAERFYLYPTYFHQGETEPRTSVTITHWCEVVRMWRTGDRDVLERIAPFVGIPRETFEARYRFRPDQALHVIAVRAFTLKHAATIAFRESYGGCLSWISLEDEIDITGSRPVLSGAELEEKIAAVARALTSAEAAVAAAVPVS